MVVLSSPALVEQISIPVSSPKPAVCYAGVPVVDLSRPEAAAAPLVKACQELGFFKLTNHGVSKELIRRLEGEAAEFFSLSQVEKETLGPPNPFGYGNKMIGANGDVGWLEYLLFAAASKPACSFSSSLKEYLKAMRRLASQVLELMAEGLEIEPRDSISRLVMDERSDGIFRLNHYPPCPPALRRINYNELTGFGEHTDPQVISILRSNNSAGLQISLEDGSWVPVQPDEDSFFINVGDSLQECEAQGGGEWEGVEGVHDLFLWYSAGGEDSAIAAADGGGGAQSVQGVHMGRVQEGSL